MRDYRKANGLCYSCGEKFVPGHMEVCTKRNKPQANALVLNDLDRELPDEVLNDLAKEDAMQEEFAQLSINAMTSAASTTCIQLKTRVHDKVMIVLVDSGSSHSFISSHFVQVAQLSPVKMKPQQVKLANGEWMITDQEVPRLQWYC